MDKLTPVFRAPQAEPARSVAADAQPPSRRPCPSRRQRRFERRLAERRAAQLREAQPA